MELPENWLAELKSAYPRRDGGGATPKIINRLMSQAIEGGARWDRILLGAKNYASHCRRKGIEGTDFVMMLKTFIGRDWHFEEWAEMDLRTPVQKSLDTEWEALERRAAAMGFHTVDRSRGLNVARSAIEAEERKRASNVLQLAGLRAKGVA